MTTLLYSPDTQKSPGARTRANTLAQWPSRDTGAMTDADTAAFPPLVVGTDPEGVKKAFRIPLAFSLGLAAFSAVAAVCAGALMGASSGFGSGILSGLPFLIIAVYQGYSAVRVTANATERAAAGPVLTLDSTGLTSNTPQGMLALPWEAISAVEAKHRGRHIIATFRVFEGVKRDSPGVQTTISPKIFRYLGKRGFRIGSAGIDVPMQTILDATAAFTGGRLVAR